MYKRKKKVRKSQPRELKSENRQLKKITPDVSHQLQKIDDLLTISPTAGYTMKAQPVNIGGVEFYRAGTIRGKALEPLADRKGVLATRL